MSDVKLLSIDEPLFAHVREQINDASFTGPGSN